MDVLGAAARFLHHYRGFDFKEVQVSEERRLDIVDIMDEIDVRESLLNRYSFCLEKSKVFGSPARHGRVL